MAESCHHIRETGNERFFKLVTNFGLLYGNKIV